MNGLKLLIRVGRVLLVSSIATFLAYRPACAEDVEHLIEPFVDSVLTQLAKRQGFNRLVLPDVDSATFGTVYYVEEGDVPCFSSLREMARSGIPLPLNSLVQFSTTNLPQPRVISDWTAIRISSLMGAEAQAQVSAKFPDQEILIDSMAASFKQTNAQILFAAREVPLLNYQRAARDQLRHEGVTDLHDISPQASGAITPFSQLIVQKFEFDQQLAKNANLGIVARFLDLFGARIAGEKSANLLQGFRLPTNAVLAIKPGFVRFQTKRCKE